MASKKQAGKPKSKASKGAEPPASPASEPATGKDVVGMISKNALNSILMMDKKNKKVQAELAGELGSKVADAVERFGTNRKALGIIRTLNRMEPEKVADFLLHLDYMLDISGIEERADAVQALPLGDKPGEDEEKPEGEAAPADGKVSRPSFGVVGGGQRH